MILFLQFNFIMNKQSSYNSTKSTSFYNSVTPAKSQHILFKDSKLSQNKEISFLHIKNKQLQQAALRLTEYVYELEQDKHKVMKLNSKYVETLNKQFINKHEVFLNQLKQCKNNSHPLCHHCNAHILIQFQKDYRNLVKHCLVLEQEIKSKNNDIEAYQSIKQQMSQANHDNIENLIGQLVQTTVLVQNLKKENNFIQYQSQKYRLQCQKYRRHKSSSQNGIEQLQAEVQSYKSMINTIQNQSVDKQNNFKARIYELQLVISKMEKETREVQESQLKIKKINQELRVEQIQCRRSMPNKEKSMSRSMVVKSGLNVFAQNMAKSRRIYQN